MGATVAYGHVAANVPAGTALTAAAADDNSGTGRSPAAGIPLLRAEMVAKLMRERYAVSGAHGR
jgi:UDP-N-acetylmuramate-alanine ligase